MPLLSLDEALEFIRAELGGDTYGRKYFKSICRDKIKSIRIGREFLIEQEDLRRYLNDREGGVGRPPGK